MQDVKRFFKFISILITLFILSSCHSGSGGGDAATPLDTTESSSTEKVISGSFEVTGTTEDIVETKISGNMTIEGAINE